MSDLKNVTQNMHSPAEFTNFSDKLGRSSNKNIIWYFNSIDVSQYFLGNHLALKPGQKFDSSNPRLVREQNP